jgi:predicted transcriptional regulator
MRNDLKIINDTIGEVNERQTTYLHEKIENVKNRINEIMEEIQSIKIDLYEAESG